MKFIKIIKSGKPTKEEMLLSLHQLSEKALAYHQDMQSAENKPINEDSITKILEHIDQIGNLIYELK